MSADFIQARSAGLDQAIEFLRRAGDYAHVPIFEAVRAGRMSLVYARERNGDLSMTVLKRQPLPTIVLIGDDDYQDCGPAGWTCTAKAMRWARYVVVHGCAGDEALYRQIVINAVLHKRLVLVETASKHVGDWMQAVAGTPALAIVPRDGGVHPVIPARSAMQ
jgi:hypothetical protein